MSSTSFTASAPGSVMLLGEHAVLTGAPALIAACDNRLNITLTPRQDEKIIVDSPVGHFETFLDQRKPVDPFKLLLTTLQDLPLQQGCHLAITADLPAGRGLGSSTALAVALLAVCHAWLNLPSNRETLYQAAKNLIRKVQGMGSGADVAASLLGGLIYYQEAATLATSTTPIKHQPPLFIVYSGKKIPTAEAVAVVEQKRQQNPEAVNEFFSQIAKGVQAARQALLEKNNTKLGQLFTKQQRVMEELQLSTPQLDTLIAQLAALPGIKGAKISGAGLGDCIIGLGNPSQERSWPYPAQEILFQYAKMGLQKGDQVF